MALSVIIKLALLSAHLRSVCPFSLYDLSDDEAAEIVWNTTLTKHLESGQLGTYCTLCDVLLPLAKMYLLKNKPGMVDRIAVIFCSVVFRPLTPKQICLGTYSTYRDDAFKILLTSSLSTKEMCRNVLACSKVAFVEWNVSLPSYEEPHVAREQSNHARPNESRPLRILHLTDIHLQLSYRPNSSAACKDPLCCSGPEVADVRERAGFFGDYRRCDLPPWTIDKILAHIGENEKFDIVYWTGDASSHEIWKQSLSETVEINKIVLGFLRKHIPSKKIYSSIGNHDIYPCNMFPMLFANNVSKLLYKSLIDDWVRMGHLPKECRQTIARGGFYSTLIGKKLRLISLNTNYGRRENFWLQVNQIDPEDQLNWLVETLKRAERKGEKVHIIAHHFPASSMWSWSANYASIVQRFNSTITAQLFGHNHFDMFTVFTDGDTPFSAAHMSPSLTTYPTQNPAYRIYTVDSTTGEILDHDTSIMDLAKSNEQGSLFMQHEYSMKAAFGLKDLSPQSLLSLVSQARQDLNGAVMDKLLSVRFKISGVLRCNKKCRLFTICSMLHYRSDSELVCKESSPIAYIYPQG